MCTDTKGRIAEAVEQMLQTRPVCKITVQSVMEQTQMKRQSFYYHYQDIYSVLEWIVERSTPEPDGAEGSASKRRSCPRRVTNASKFGSCAANRQRISNLLVSSFCCSA